MTMNIEKLIERLTQKIIKPFLLEEEGITIGLIPGSFRPPHRGHFELIKKASEENKHVFVIVSSSTNVDQKKGFSSKSAERIWEKYLKYITNAKYIKSDRPVTVVYEVVNILNNGKYISDKNKKATPISTSIATQIKSFGDKFNINVYVGDEEDKSRYSQFETMPERYSTKNVTSVKINVLGRVEGLKAEYLRVALQKQEFDRISDFLPTELNDSEKEEVIELMKKGRLSEIYWPEISSMKSSEGKNPILDLALEYNKDAYKYFRENIGAEIFLTFNSDIAIKVKRIGQALGGKISLDIINRSSVPDNKPNQVVAAGDENYNDWIQKFYSQNNWIKGMMDVVSESVITEGGNIFKDEGGVALTQRINKADIIPTVEWLERVTKLSLLNNMLGSTGQKDTSSDLDLSVDINSTSKDALILILSDWCVKNKLTPKDNIRKSGTSVHFKTPIRGDTSNGFVQTDFMFFSDIEFSKFALIAKPSKYSGKERQFLLAKIAQNLGYSWSAANGLVGLKNPLDSRNPDAIVKIMLNRNAVVSDFDTVETILSALENDPKRSEKLKGYDIHGYTNILKEGGSVENRILLQCGGSGGHIKHPYEFASTGNELVEVFNKIINHIKKNTPSVKIDGINVSSRFVEGQFVWDRGSAKPLDVNGITANELEERFEEGHGLIEVGKVVLGILNSAKSQVQSELKTLGMLDNPNLMLNIEYVSGKTNVKDYGKKFLAVHNMLEIGFKDEKQKSRVTKMVNYDKSAMDSFLSKVNKAASKFNFEVTGKIEATFKSNPNFSSVLSQQINVTGLPPKTLKSYLDELVIPKYETRVKFKDGSSHPSSGGKVLTTFLDPKDDINTIIEKESMDTAVSGFITQYATMVLGEEILKNLDSKLGDVNKQEGIVVNGLFPDSVKVTGRFILDKNLTSFRKNKG